MSRFRFVRAAGGVVTDPQGNSLLIFREGCWDIPKGMVEPGESLAQAAIREVEEETGISHIALDSLLVDLPYIQQIRGLAPQANQLVPYAHLRCPTHRASNRRGHHPR